MRAAREDIGRTVVGVDCATNPKNVGLAVGSFFGARVRIDGVAVLATWSDIDAQVSNWLDEGALLALDAPLGWPSGLGDVLAAHSAGTPVDRLTANAMFRRATDDRVAEELGKRPLDVGADRIARTAHAALSFLGRLRARTGFEIPLAWTPGALDGPVAVEVYPAGTLASRKLPCSGYKQDSGPATSLRRRLISALEREVELDATTVRTMAASDDVLDAVICVVAGADFLRGDVMQPGDRDLAEREGWIWVRPPTSTG